MINIPSLKSYSIQTINLQGKQKQEAQLMQNWHPDFHKQEILSTV